MIIFRPEYLVKIENIEQEPPTFYEKRVRLAIEPLLVVLLLIISGVMLSYSVSKMTPSEISALALGMAVGKVR